MFAGYLAISDFFKADGGIQVDGIPSYEGFVGSLAICVYLDILPETEDNLVHDDLTIRDNVVISKFYEKPWSEVTAEDVAKKLEELLEDVASLKN